MCILSGPPLPIAQHCLLVYRSPGVSWSTTECVRNSYRPAIDSVAIWYRNIIVSGTAILGLLISVALNFRGNFVYSTVPSRRLTYLQVLFIASSEWVEELGVCDLVTGNSLTFNVPALFATDLFLLLVMLVGLLRDFEARQAGIYRVLIKQV